MAHDVFISYSNLDAAVAQSACAALEQDGLRCWIAPRDITPGVKYAAALVDAISTCRVFLLILSKNSNESPQVEMEVDRAASKNLPILCFRIDDVRLSKTLEYYLSSRHWLDASQPPLEQHIRSLVRTVRDLVKGPGSMSSVPSVRTLSLAERLADEQRLWENPLVVVARGMVQPEGRAVLVTRVRPRLTPAGDFLARFDLLAESLARVEPDYLAKVVDYGEQDGRAVVVEQAPGGRRLAELLQDSQGLTQAQVFDLASRLGELLSALHRKHLLMLVLDPQCLWLEDDGRLTASGAGIPQGANISRLLSSGKLEPGFLHAPELCRGEPGETCTDFYSLGALLYRMLAGHEPEVAAPGDRTPAPGELAPSRWRSELVGEWDDLVHRCLQPVPARRIQSTAEYTTKLEEVRHGLEIAGEGGAAAKEDTLLGQTLGGYQIVQKLGQGGMASVYKAYESALDRYVAVKVLPAFLAGDASFAQRFRREARAIAHLSHPNIIPIHNFGEDKGIPYIVMQLMLGGTLKRPTGQTYTPEQALRLLLPVTRALAYAHQRGIIHRDLKPGNILLTEEGWPVIADFGLVQMAEASSRLTTSGVGLGTPAYMSPEQGQGEKVDPRSDIYSLGIIIYEMLTGDVPFHASTPVGILLKHATEPLPPTRKLKPGIPAEVEAIIRKAAAKDPQERYQSADEMAAAMEAALKDLTAPAPQKAAVKASEKKAGKLPEKIVEKPLQIRVEQVPLETRPASEKEARKAPVLRLPVVRIKWWAAAAGVVGIALIALGGIFGPRMIAGPGMPTLTPFAGYGPTPNLTLWVIPTVTLEPAWSLFIKTDDLARDRVTAFAVDPGDSRIFYAGTLSSGIYQTDDGGQSWHDRWNDLGSASIGSLAIDPGSPGVMYAGVYASGLYRSQDSGASWEIVQPSVNTVHPACANVVLVPDDPDRLYYSDGKNLFHSPDMGLTWTNMENDLFLSGLCGLAIARWDHTNLWGTLANGGLYMSTDAGASWDPFEPWKPFFPGYTLTAGQVWLDPNQNGVLYVSAYDTRRNKNFLLRSPDKGASWTISETACSGMAFLIPGPEVFCIGGRDLFISKDYGQSWTAFRDLFDASLFVATPNLYSTSLYIGSWGLYRFNFSQEQVTLETMNNGLGAVRVEFLLNPAFPDTLFLTSVDGLLPAVLYKDEGNGASLTDIFNGPTGYQNYTFDDGGSIYATTDSNLMKFNDGSGSFDKLASLDSSRDLRLTFHPFAHEAYATGDAEYLFRSGNRGASWEKIPVQGAGAGRLFFSEMDPETILSVTGEETYISHDKGSSWQNCGGTGDAPPSSTAAIIDARSGDINNYRIYRATRGEGLAVSSDSCKTWSSITSPFRSLFINSVVLDPRDPDWVYVGTDAGAYQSRDQGETWSELSDGLPGRGTVYSLLVQENGSVFAATSFGIYKMGTTETQFPYSLQGFWEIKDLRGPDNSLFFSYASYFQFTNTRQYVYHGSEAFNSDRPDDVSDIVYLNLNDSTFIKKIISSPNHPEYEGKFEKWTWRFENENVLLFTVYETRDSLDLARSDSTITALGTGVRVPQP